MDNKLKKLILGYDVIFPYCEVPNALNPKYLSFAEHCDWTFDKSEQYFLNELKIEWPVFNGRFMVQLNDESGNPGYFAADKKLVYDIIKDRERGKPAYDWYYLIEPYGHIDNFLGLRKEFKNEYFDRFIPKKTLEEIRDGHGKLIINYAIDGGFETHNVIQLKKSLDNLNLPKEKIIIIHNDINLENMMKPLFGENMPKLIHYCFSLNSKSQEYYKKETQKEYYFWQNEDRRKKYDFQNKEESLKLDNKTHKFLNLNRRLRKHRFDILKFFWDENMIDDVLISYDYKLLVGDTVEHSIQKYGIDEFNRFINYLNENPKKTLDYDDLESVWGYGYETKEIYNQSLISILSETNFYEETGYLSEKIWKPIAHGHPFILVGPYNSLKSLREDFGFKTFSAFIDESYDEEKDPNIRMKMIQDEIKKLNNYSLEELKQIVKELKTILLHNRNLLFKYGSKSHICLDYLHYLRISDRDEEANEILKLFLQNLNQTKLI
jgi:hypothetical protein